MKKRLFTIFALVLLLFTSTLIVGCKKKNNKPAEVTLTFVASEETVSSKKVTKGYTIVESDFPTNVSVPDGHELKGWFIEDLRISAGYIVNSNTTIVAKFEKTIVPVTQDGTKEHPYIIETPEDLVNFSDRLNHMDEEVEDENYYKAHFVLGNDIDMAGVNYTPAGKEITLNDGEKTIHGFMGFFDGQGHKISNLTISVNMKTNRDYYGGLFALTNTALIRNLTLENINYSVESGSDDANRRIIMGGIVAVAELSVFENINVTGIITTYIFDNNGAYFGGIAGMWDVSDSAKSYYAYTRNCYTNIETKIGELDGEVCSLESAFNGGLFGYVYNYNSAVAIYNCITSGNIHGGKYLGGLVGAFASDNVSVIDCGSYAQVYATGKEVSYAGGLVGMSQADIVIKDSFYNGPVVRGTRATSSNYSSYAGGIVGYATMDDYENYYTGGIACVNSYYKTTVRGADVTTEFGTSTESEINQTFVKDTLNWSDNAYTYENNIIIPNHISIDEEKYQVKLVVDGKEVDSFEKDGNTILGTIEDGKNNDSMVFYDWMLQDGSIYRPYMPVTKDLTIYGKYYDVSTIAGIYSGTATLYETRDAGLIILFDNGTLQWINSSTVNGIYRYDGEHLLFEVFNNISDVSGILTSEGLTFYVDAGMSGNVYYEFKKIEQTIFGEYFSDAGDIITFGSEGKISFQSTKLKDGDYVNGTYTQNGTVLTVTGEHLNSTYSSMTIVDNGDLTLTANFTSTNPNVPSLENVVFRKILTKDYATYPFIGSYDFVYVNGYRPINQSKYTLDFKADGSASYISEYSTVEAQYYVFNQGKTIKLILEGYASEFTYDEEGNFFHGMLHRGTGSIHRGVALIPTEAGAIYGLVLNDVSNVLFTTGELSYLFIDGIYQKDAVISVPSLEDRTRITINDQAYILIHENSEYTTRIGYFLEKVGPEEGTYSYNGKAFSFDGIGNVIGEITGMYMTYQDGLAVILTADDQFIGFNYVDAKAANGAITYIEPDKYQGIWFADYTVSGETDEDHYKLLIDGYGHTTFMYKKYIPDTEEFYYTYNWGDTGWVNFTETPTGISCDYNKYQHCDMRFYYNGDLMYSTNFGYIGTIAMTKVGYTGPVVPPTLPTSAVGKYVGENSDGISVVLNLRQDLNGTYAGTPFVATYDGGQIVTFKINSTVYQFNITTLVLSYDNQTITLTSDGAIEEIIPEAICGVWSGNWEGFGADEHTTLTIEKDGTVKYVDQAFSNVTFDYETQTIRGTASTSGEEDATIVIVYNSETNTINVEYLFGYDGGSYTITGTDLTKK